MATFGKKLKEAREVKGLLLEDVARDTRVRLCHLEALERDDFDAMPQDVFVRGFVRMYADCLGVDPKLLVAEYRRERDSQRPTWEEGARNEVVEQVPRQVSAENSRHVLKFAVLVVLAVVVLALAGVWWVGARGRDEVRPVSPRLEPEPEPEPVVMPASAPVVEALPERAAREPVATELPVEELLEPEPLVEAVVERAAPEPAVELPAKPEPRDPVPVEAGLTPPGDQGRRATPEPDSRPEPSAGRLTIAELGVGTGIENRQLVGEGRLFVEGTQVWFWTRVLGGTPGETIRHVWKHEGHGSSWVPLTLGGEHWRTQSRKMLHEGSAGRWTVEAVDGKGRVLARREFVCVSEAPARRF